VGYVWFAGTGGQMTGTQSFFWDNNNKWLGLGTNTPTAPFDIHITSNIGIQINNTATGDSKIAFLHADTGKWRIGNLYSGGANLFHIYNNVGATLAMQINSSNAALFYGSLSSNSFVSAGGGISLTNGFVPTTAGATGIGGLTAGLSIALASGFNQTLTFPTGVAYTYTFPSATGTLALTSNLGGTTGYLPKYASGTSLGQSLIYDNGTNVGINTSSPLASLDVCVLSSGARRLLVNYADSIVTLKSSNESNGGENLRLVGDNVIFNSGSSGNGTERMRITSGGVSVFGYTAAVGTAFSPPVQVKGGAGSGNGFGIISSNNEIAGGIQLSSSGSNSLQITADPDNLRASSEIGFSIDGSQKMVITSGGVLNMYYTFNSTADGECFIIDTNPSNSGSRRVLTVQGGVFGSSGDSSSKLIIFQSGNGTELGSIRRDGGSGVSYLSSSDYRLKEDLKDYDALQIISNIKTYDYKWKDVSLRNYGVMAHELQEILPYAVGGVKDEVDDNGNIKVQGVDYSKLVPITIKAIQQLDNRLTALENLN
jgi:hypothetical protein